MEHELEDRVSDVPEELLVCSNGGCTLPKPLSHFTSKRTGKRTKLCQACRDNAARSHNKHRAVRKPEMLVRRRLRLYGLTEEEYQVKILEQEGKCWICGDPPKEDRALCVDHNHETKKVRGLLCLRCNTGLGNLGDSKERLVRALTYLETFDA